MEYTSIFSAEEEDQDSLFTMSTRTHHDCLSVFALPSVSCFGLDFGSHALFPQLLFRIDYHPFELFSALAFRSSISNSGTNIGTPLFYC